MATLAELVRTSPKKPDRVARAGKPQKTELDKIVENFDKQLGLYTSGSIPSTPGQERKMWFRNRGDEIAIQVKKGNTPLSLMDGQKTLYTDPKNVKQVAKLLRANLVSGEYQAEIDDLEKARAAKRAKTKS